MATLSGSKLALNEEPLYEPTRGLSADETPGPRCVSGGAAWVYAA